MLKYTLYLSLILFRPKNNVNKLLNTLEKKLRTYETKDLLS